MADDFTGEPDFEDGALRVIEGGKGKVRRTGKGSAPRPLTGKQLAFIQGILRGESQCAAYEAAYDVGGMGKSAIYTEAGRLFRNPRIAHKIEQGREAQTRSALHSGASYRHSLIRKLGEIIDSNEAAATRLRAMELLGKTEHVSLFLARSTDVTEDLSASEIEAELETLLASTGSDD
jgi:hypothetical protein